MDLTSWPPPQDPEKPLREGWLMQRCVGPVGGAWIRQYCVLLPSRLIWFESLPQAREGKPLSGSLILAGVDLKVVTPSPGSRAGTPGARFGFTLCPPGSVTPLAFFTSCLQLQTDWTTDLCAAIHCVQHSQSPVKSNVEISSEEDLNIDVQSKRPELKMSFCWEVPQQPSGYACPTLPVASRHLRNERQQIRTGWQASLRTDGVKGIMRSRASPPGGLSAWCSDNTAKPGQARAATKRTEHGLTGSLSAWCSDSTAKPGQPLAAKQRNPQPVSTACPSVSPLYSEEFELCGWDGLRLVFVPPGASRPQIPGRGEYNEDALGVRLGSPTRQLLVKELAGLSVHESPPAKSDSGIRPHAEENGDGWCGVLLECHPLQRPQFRFHISVSCPAVSLLVRRGPFGRLSGRWSSGSGGFCRLPWPAPDSITVSIEVAEMQNVSEGPQRSQDFPTLILSDALQSEQHEGKMQNEQGE